MEHIEHFTQAQSNTKPTLTTLKIDLKQKIQTKKGPVIKSDISKQEFVQHLTPTIANPPLSLVHSSKPNEETRLVRVLRDDCMKKERFVHYHRQTHTQTYTNTHTQKHTPTNTNINTNSESCSL